MTAVIADLSIVWGRTAILNVTVGGLGASGLDAYDDMRFTAKRDVSDSDSGASISKRLSAGISITTAGDATTNGVLAVAINPADTAGLPAAYVTTLAYDVSVYDSAANAYSVAQGVLTVAPTATQATT